MPLPGNWTIEADDEVSAFHVAIGAEQSLAANLSKFLRISVTLQGQTRQAVLMRDSRAGGHGTEFLVSQATYNTLTEHSAHVQEPALGEEASSRAYFRYRLANDTGFAITAVVLVIGIALLIFGFIAKAVNGPTWFQLLLLTLGLVLGILSLALGFIKDYIKL